MRRFRLSGAVDADLRKIAKHTLQQWSEPKRDAYITELFDAFARLAETPQIATSAEAIRTGCRKLPQGSHIIEFRESDTHRIASHRIASHRIASHRIASHRIEIIRILHKRIDAEAHLNSS